MTPFDQALGGVVEDIPPNIQPAGNLPTDQSDIEKGGLGENQGILNKVARGSTPNSRRPSFRRVLF